MKKIEILAPAGSMESVFAAVRCGADAIYLGAESFSARQNATNFSKEELKQAVEYCHLHNVKVHQAINTLVFDSQLEEMLKTAEYSAKIGVDAFIIHDLGAFSVLKNAIPDMDFHASTQMTVHTKEGAAFAKELGFSRVVLARELSKQQIKDICTVDIEVEAFVHGALCMCVSGQCYMSAMIGSRSANRGLCAQACRLPFSHIKDTERYDLSLKDMSLVKYINEMADLGVMSFKIEGRMKRPEYVAAAVSACRNSADGKTFDTETLQAVFSRSGFTEGYYTNCIDEDMFGTRVKENVVSANDVLPELKQLYHKDIKSDDIQFVIEIKANKPTKLTAKCDGICVTVEGDVPQNAINRPTDYASAEKQLSKLGDTVYNYTGLMADIDDGLMLPASSLNDLRRRVIEALDIQRIEKNNPNYTISKTELTFPKKLNIKHRELRIELSDLSFIDELKLENVAKIIAPLSEVFKYSEKLLEYKDKIIIAPKRFNVDEGKCIDELLKLKNMGFDKLYCNNVSHISIGKKLGFKLFGGFGLNALNSYTLKLLSEEGLCDTVLSFEMKLSQINSLADYLPFGIIAYGKLPLMLVRNCPIKSNVGCKNCTKSLYDRTERKFSVTCDGTTSEILNSDVLYLADRLDEIRDVDFITLKFHNENALQVNKIIKEYTVGGNPPEKFTRGLYYRGIK